MVFVREMAWSDLQFHLLAQVREKGLGEGKRGVGIVQTRDGEPGVVAKESERREQWCESQ